MTALARSLPCVFIHKNYNIGAILRSNKYSSTTDEGSNIKNTENGIKLTEASDLNAENKIASEDKKLGGFAKAFEKYTAPPSEISPKSTKDESFLTLLRKSKFVDLGDPEKKVVEGVIFHSVGDDLYIDFDGKLPCVCMRPAKNGSAYMRGAKVRLRIKELELSTRFLGSERDMTLLEADAILLGLISSPIAR